ncbi:hypothetical protein D9758_010729 [Tetrapyrgos nigripes]|uniref:Uncharacterized protein n=1 Tax=Tetrapyrgos nigripes TaxID=182062 RepID=A0A8H5D8U1_9AGAR|nr:hypothetical protein D9758_010729 [Tetrapyrgos nigripes]
MGSVLDLNGRNPSSIDLGSAFAYDQNASSPTTSQSAGGLGDLRNISRRGWSKSADDLVRLSPMAVEPTIEEKIAQYRNRSNSNGSLLSPSSPTMASPTTPKSHTPAGQAVAAQPFPSMESPVRSRFPPTSTAPMVSISISAPTVDEASTSPSSTPERVHTRSHSFTPKLSSKLSAPRFIPPSPKRKGSAGSEIESNSPSSSSRGPPALRGSGDNDDSTSSSNRDLRRASQIVYNSGFINKFLDTTSTNLHHVNLAPIKAWKPFKLELKGSKLYFYKPPSDRANGIKELFPPELVPASEQDEDETPDVEEDDPFLSGGGGGSGRGRAGAGRRDDQFAGRKKRAFWGRRTHPDLVRDAEGNIEKGTFEALTHEAVFGTTFLLEEQVQGTGEAEVEAEGQEERPVADNEKKQSCQEERWKDFAASILLCMPYLVNTAKFEGEFARCGEYLLSGADDETKERERSRLRWLVREYQRFHGKRVSIADLGESDADVATQDALAPRKSALPASSSTQAIFNPTPTTSPNLGMFSPRPGGPSDNSISLMDSFGNGATPTLSPTKGHFDADPGRKLNGALISPKTASTASLPSWAGALDREGLSRDVFLLIEHKVLAKSLGMFHSSVLQQFPENLTADFVFSEADSAETGPSSSSSTSHSSAYSALFGSDDQPHWLTKLLLLQILGADTSTGLTSVTSNSNINLTSPGRNRGDATATSSSAQPQSRQHPLQHSRSELIASWIRVGEICRVSGDGCSWQAIMQAICSAPIARLEKIWKKVDPAAIATVESWVQVGAEGESVGVKEPRITPWGGDIRNLVRDEMAKVVSGEMLSLAPIEKAKNLFETFRTSFSLCPRKSVADEGESGEDIKKLVSYWWDVLIDGNVGGIAAKFQRIEQFMSLSLAAEPRRRGLYEPHHSAKSPNNPPVYTSLIPLLFPEPLPTICIIDRNSILRGRLDSDTTDIQHLRAVDGHLRPEAQQSSSSNPLGNGATFIPVYNGDLLLAAQNPVMDSVPNSRPSSLVRSRPPSSVIDDPLEGKSEKPVGRTPSIRVKPGTSAGLDRKSSLAKRNSLPSLSRRQPVIVSETSSEPPLRVIIQAGTAEKLVEVLVHGLPSMVVSVSDDNGEMSLKEGRNRELLLDHKEFSKIWWNVYRSFLTPIIFFELLRKVYLRVQTPSTAISVEDYLKCISSRTAVLETLKTWLSKGGGAQDMLDDVQLLQALRTFLDSSSDHFIPVTHNLNESSVKQAWDALNDARKLLKRNVHSYAMRPPISRTAPFTRQALTASDSRVRNLSSREPPDMDRLSVEEFVDNLDGMAFAAFNNVNEEDLYATCDYLEVQSADRTGWFPTRDPPSVEEMIEIQTIYSHLLEVEPSPLISELSPESLYRVLPPGVRSCLRAHIIVRKWLISKIVALRIGLRARQNRMEYLLRVIEVSRLRNNEIASSGELATTHCVRSFVESVITSAVLSPESRLYQRAWHNVAVTRGCQMDSLAALLERPAKKSASSKEPLTIDLGWLFERLLDVISMPDMVESTTQEGQNLVNFDKRRNLCNFISNAPSLLSRRLARQEDINRCGFERLYNIDREVHAFPFDFRSIKDEASREAMASSAGAPPPPKKMKLVTAQMDKNRRDKNMRSRLQKEKHNEQARNEKREEMLNRAMRGGRRPSSTTAKHRNKKSVSALFHFMRPLSTAFGAETTPALKRTASELDFVASGKPSLVLNLTDSRVSQFINNDRSYTFQLDTEDGGHYLLQALSKREMTKWIETLTKVSNTAAKRRLTYMGSPKPQVADHIQAQPATATRDPTAVFGVELEFLLEREYGDPPPPGSIPSALRCCIAEVETRGLTEQGIYRMAGAASDINSLKDAFNQGRNPISEATYIHAVCDLIKSWFRVLPEPIFPPFMYHEFIDSTKSENLDDRISNLRKLVHRLPQANFDVLKRIMEHLDTVTDFEEHNQMTAEGLSIVWSPNLLRAPQNDFFMALSNMPHSHKLVKTMITHFHVIFDESDPEAEADPEEDLDTPIEEEEGEDDDSLPFGLLVASSNPRKDTLPRRRRSSCARRRPYDKRNSDDSCWYLVPLFLREEAPRSRYRSRKTKETSRTLEQETYNSTLVPTPSSSGSQIPETFSGDDVKRLLTLLNSHISFFASQVVLAEAQESEVTETEELQLDIRKACQDMEEILGSVSLYICLGKGKTSAEEYQFVIQHALQALLSGWCARIIETWSWSSKLDGNLKDMYDGLKATRSQATLSKWRSVTRTQCNSDRDSEAYSKLVKRASNSVVAFVTLIRPERPVYSGWQDWIAERVSSILQKASQIREIIGEKITSTDYEVIHPCYGEVWDDKLMLGVSVSENSAGERQKHTEGTTGDMKAASPKPVFCGSQLGLRQIDQIISDSDIFRQSNVVMKANVLLIADVTHIE